MCPPAGHNQFFKICKARLLRRFCGAATITLGLILMSVSCCFPCVSMCGDLCNVLLLGKVILSTIEDENRYIKEIQSSVNKQTFAMTLDDPICFRGCPIICSKFVKWAICIHVFAFSTIFNEELHDESIINQKKSSKKEEGCITQAKSGAHTIFFKSARS